jgi:hypothetical protein
MNRALASLLVFAVVVVLVALVQMARAENLPVTVQRYEQACTKVHGALTRNLNSSNVGTIYCVWAPQRDRTECKVGSNQVNVCTIRCSSDACYVANPRKDKPVWPLNGGPGRQGVAPAGTLAPDTLAPVN